MLHQRTRLLSSLVTLCAAGVLLAGCGAPQNPAPAGNDQRNPSEPTESPLPEQLGSSGTYELYRSGATAVTYAPAQVPAGAKAKVTLERLGDGVATVTARLTGLRPNREYGAHAHTKPCGATGDDAGPHFQQVADPVKPSVDAAYANPRNEVWLDFRTDSRGNASRAVTGTWKFEGRGDVNSFVIHETHTHAEPGQAGKAGARLACLNARF